MLSVAINQSSALPTIDTRNTEAPVPQRWQRMLSDDQIITINQQSNYGWDLWFIRRRGQVKPLPVLKNHLTGQAVVVERDGELNHSHGFTFRD